MSTYRDPRVTEVERRLANTSLIGRVSQVDHEKARYRVKSGNTETDWIPFVQRRAGGTKTYESLDVGEQVMVLAPSGDLAQGVIIGALSTDETQPADKGNIHRTVYPDGTVVDYDDEAKSYLVTVAEGGAINMSVAGGGVNITCENAVVNASAEATINSPSVNLGGPGGKPVARIGDLVNVGSGSSTGLWPIVEGSSVVKAVD